LRAADDSLARRFADPPSQARILKIIHSWPDHPYAQDEMIRLLTRQGFGGVVCDVSFHDYLQSDAMWRSLVRAVGEAKKAGWALWLYDERGYPSGKAGGIVLKDHPQWEASGLLIADAATEGATVSLALPPGELFFAGALPAQGGQIDLAGRVDLAGSVRDGRLRWQPPSGSGSWRVLLITRSRLFKGTHCETNLSDRLSYPNLLSAEPTRRFLEVTHDRYAAWLGSDLGKLFVATFTDEPSLMSAFMKPMPYRVLPWSSGLPGEFQSRRGYPLAPIVPDLVLDAGPGGRRHRYDFWLTISELVAENYFGQIQRWCRLHGLGSGGHLLMEESLSAHVPLYGDFLRCARRLDAPGIDCLTSLPAEAPWYIARLLASAAELEEKTTVMSETSDHAQRYRPPGDSRPVREVTEAEIRGTCNWLILSGVNCITSHYSFAGISDEALRRLNTWVGRCCTMLTGGHQAADIALLYPIESVWTRFIPSHEWTRDAHEAAKIESIYRAVMDRLYDSRRDFTIVDSRSLCEGSVEPGTMVHGSLRWRVIVLPGADTLPLAAWENLGRFARSGGVVIALGRLPANSESDFPSSRVLDLGREIFGTVANHPVACANPAGGGGVFLPAGTEDLLPIVLGGALDPDVRVREAASPLRMTHRRIDHHEIYFLINDSSKPWRGEVEFAAKGSAEKWAPASGTMRTVGSGPISLDLDAYGAVFVRLSESQPPARHGLTSGRLPNLEMEHDIDPRPQQGTVP
jgi:hypothetical protein